MTFTTDSKTKETARADEVETLNKTKNESRIRLGQQLAKMIKPDLQVSPHLHFATTLTVSILTFNYILVDISDHRFPTFTFKNLSDREKPRTLQIRARFWAKIPAAKLAILELTKSPSNSENQLDLLAKNFHRNILIPITSRSKNY